MFKNDRFEPFSEDFSIAEPNDAETSSGEHQVSLQIVGRLLRGFVDLAIQLDDQAELGAEEVDDEAFDHHLTTEIVAADRVASEELPSTALSGCGFSS